MSLVNLFWVFNVFRGSSPGRGSEFFSSPPRPDRLWGPPILLSNGYKGFFFLGLRRPGCGALHSSPSSAEVKNAWSYTSTPPICLHGVVLSEAQGQLYLSLSPLPLQQDVMITQLSPDSNSLVYDNDVTTGSWGWIYVYCSSNSLITLKSSQDIWDLISNETSASCG
jgi:hypothetical protein